MLTEQAQQRAAAAGRRAVRASNRTRLARINELIKWILVPKLHLGTPMLAKLCFAYYRHSSQRNSGIPPGSHSCAEE